MRRRLRAHHQAVLLDGVVDLVQGGPGLDGRGPAAGIDLDDLVTVFGAVQDDRLVAALPGQAGPAPAGQHRDIELPASADGRVRRPRHHDADRRLAVVRPVMRVRAAGPRIEPHLPVDGFLESVLELFGIHRSGQPSRTRGSTSVTCHAGRLPGEP